MIQDISERTILVKALVISLFLKKLTVSRLYVEKVVSQPKKPIKTNSFILSETIKL